MVWRLIAKNKSKMDAGSWMNTKIPYELFLIGGPKYKNGRYSQVYKTPIDGLYVEIVRL